MASYYYSSIIKIQGFFPLLCAHSTGHHSVGLVRWTLETIARGNNILKEGTICICSTTRYNIRIDINTVK